MRVCLYVLCGHLLGKGNLLALVCGVYFPIGILGQMWYLIVSIPDLCTFTYFKRSTFLKQKKNIGVVIGSVLHYILRMEHVSSTSAL